VSDRPPLWSVATLGNILRFNYGKSLPERDRSGTGFPVYGSNGIVGYHNNSLTSGETLIIGRKGSVGEVHFSFGPCFPIDTTYYVDTFYGMPVRYWLYQLKNLRLSELNKATAIPGINREDAYRTEIKLAPLNEQKRIADKLDRLLAKVDACRERCDRIPLILGSISKM
jgi:type I restriction enzyme, S subunit